MARYVVEVAGSLVEVGVVVGIGAGVDVAIAVVGTVVVVFVTGVGAGVTPELVGLGAGIVRPGTDVGAVGPVVITNVAFGTGDMIVGAVAALMRSGVSVAIWLEASVAVSSSMALDFAGGLVAEYSGVGAGPEQARRPIRNTMVPSADIFLNPRYSLFPDNCSIAPLIPYNAFSCGSHPTLPFPLPMSPARSVLLPDAFEPDLVVEHQHLL